MGRSLLGDAHRRVKHWWGCDDVHDLRVLSVCNSDISLGNVTSALPSGDTVAVAERFPSSSCLGVSLSKSPSLAAGSASAW